MRRMVKGAGWGWGRSWLLLGAVVALALTACGGGGEGGGPVSAEVPVNLGQPGPGDAGNYFPFMIGNRWQYQVTTTEAGLPPQTFVNTETITGTRPVGGVTTTVFADSNPDGSGVPEEFFLVKDLNGIAEFSDPNATDPLSAQLPPLWDIRFPLAVGTSFVQVDRKGLNAGDDLDGDGINERVDIRSEVAVAGFETVTVPVGTFADCARLVRSLTLTIILSGDGRRVTASDEVNAWFAPGVGRVKETSSFTTTLGNFSETTTETVELIGFAVDGQTQAISIVAPNQAALSSGAVLSLSATALNPAGTPVAVIPFTWASSNPAVASVDASGRVLGGTPGSATITASLGDIVSNPVAITVVSGTQPPGNLAPVANAGPTQHVQTGSLVTLDGRASFDVNGDLLSFNWTITAKPGGSNAALAGATTAGPTFTADVEGTYLLSLVVNDGSVNSAAATVRVTAATGNSMPVADAGPDLHTLTGALVTLNGSGSFDVDGDLLTYSWTLSAKPGGSVATLTGATSVASSFTADVEGTYVVNLVVNDGTVDSVADTATLTALRQAILVPSAQPTIQQAIVAAANGDTILVAPGTYLENINFLGKAVSVVSSAGPETTIIDGNQAGSVATFASGEGPASLLTGFTLRNGRPDFGGGGINIQSSSPTITGNIITDNQACIGAGIAVSFGSPTIQGNTISRNIQAGCSGGIGGGGISIGGSAAAQILDNVITDNSTGSEGGGISLFAAGTPTIRGNTISRNTASSGGGISMGNFSDALIVQNLITGNRAGSGGGISWLVPAGERGPLLVNNIIADNDSGQGSGIFADGFDAQTALVNNIVVGKLGQTAVFCGAFNDLNPPVFRFNDIFTPSGVAYGGICADQTSANGNISADPFFKDPVGGNYRLHATSPAIDAGDNAAPDLPVADLDGNLRVQDGDADGAAVVDMGAFEFVLPTLNAAATSSCAPAGVNEASGSTLRGDDIRRVLRGLKGSGW